MTGPVPVDHDPFANPEPMEGVSPWPAPKKPSEDPLTSEYWGERFAQLVPSDLPHKERWRPDPEKGFWENEWDRFERGLSDLAWAFGGAGEEGLRVHPISAVPMAAYETYEGLKHFAETPKEERPVPAERPSAWQSMKEAFGGPPLLTGIFAGPKAKTANLALLREARRLEGQGTAREDIWANTGWFRGADNNWRFEIPDDLAKLSGVKPVIEGVQHRFTGIEHPELQRAYDIRPEMHGEYGIFNPGQAGRHIPESGTRPSGLQGVKGEPEPSYRPARIEAAGPTAEEAKSVGLHELQHEVSAREGFPQGTTSGYEAWRFVAQPELERLPAYQAILNEPAIQRAYRKFERHHKKIGNDPWASSVSDVERARWLNLRDDYVNRVAEQAYHRNTDEVLARATQSRMNLTPAERTQQPPWTSEDVPRELQLIRERQAVPAASAQQGKYAYSTEELPYALTWGEGGGLVAHGLVKSRKFVPEIETWTKEGTPKQQQQARMRVNYMAQQANSLKREWQHSGNEAHKAAIDDVVQATGALKKAYEAADWQVFRQAATETQQAIDRFSGYTGKHYEALEAKRGASHAAGGAARHNRFPHARSISGKWMIPDPHNPGQLIEIT